MDILLSALAGDAVSRCVSFLITKHQTQSTTDKLARLQRLLLRARIVLEEAEGRHISSQGMLLQLKQLRRDMCRGYYVLDAFRRNAAVSKSFNQNKLNIALEGLEATMGDVKEFVVFLVDCPRMFRQPYSTYLFMEGCMFGRHIEKEQIINFLLEPCNSSLGVLPVLGPREIGKSTLVEHVCNEERVREQFSCIVRLNSADLNHLENGSFTRNMERVISNARSMVVVELVRDIGDATWRRFHSLICSKNGDNKVILISTMEKVTSLGTTSALRLKKLRPDEYWYFFRTLAFGSTNPEDHQGLASIAWKIATQLRCSVLAANIFTRLLRANLNAHFWSQMLEFVREDAQRNIHVFGEDKIARIRKSRPYLFSDYVDGSVLLCNAARCLVKGELPKITSEDIITGKGTYPSEGSFDLLRWQSPIAPYYCYVANCVVKKAEQVVPKQKCRKRKRRLENSALPSCVVEKAQQVSPKEKCLTRKRRL